MEQLKRRGHYSVHAAAVAVGDKCLIMPGTSGSGKTTLALALARAGFAFLSDDMVYLSSARGRLEALAFPEAFDVTDETVGLFPELSALRASKKLPGAPKHQLRVESRYEARVAWRCAPVALVFPSVAQGSSVSTLEPMDPGSALLELVPNVLLTETRSSQRHLDALAALVSTCACYRLSTGRDFDALAIQLRQLLETRS